MPFCIVPIRVRVLCSELRSDEAFEAFAATCSNAPTGRAMELRRDP